MNELEIYTGADDKIPFAFKVTDLNDGCVVGAEVRLYVVENDVDQRTTHVVESIEEWDDGWFVRVSVPLVEAA